MIVNPATKTICIQSIIPVPSTARKRILNKEVKGMVNASEIPFPDTPSENKPINRQDSEQGSEQMSGYSMS